MSDDEIITLWRKFKTTNKRIASLYLDKEYQQMAQEEEIASNDGAIRLFIRDEFPDYPQLPNRQDIYEDMIEFVIDPRARKLFS